MITLTIEVDEETAEKLRSDWNTYVTAVGKFVPFTVFIGERLIKQYAKEKHNG